MSWNGGSHIKSPLNTTYHLNFDEHHNEWGKPGFFYQVQRRKGFQVIKSDFDQEGKRVNPHAQLRIDSTADGKHILVIGDDSYLKR